MSDEQSLVRAILAAPADDLPRLVYADWLEENAGEAMCPKCKGTRIERRYESVGREFSGFSMAYRHYDCPCGSGHVPDGRRERAEFVRVQCERARLDGGERCPVCGWPYMMGEGCEPGNCSFRPGEHTAEYARWKERQTAYHALRQRERELFQFHVKELLPRSLDARLTLEPRMLTGGGVTALVRRGFVESVASPLATFLGEPCEACRYSDMPPRIVTRGGLDECAACRGIGRVGGCAAAVAAGQPVARWVLDREPSNGTTTEFHWFANDGYADDITPHSGKHKLTWGLANYLPVHRTMDYHPNFRQRLWFYPTRDAALDALSLACTSYARNAAVAAKLVPDLWGEPVTS
jgi:uncharacterized protein (TIGR02996 family)